MLTNQLITCLIVAFTLTLSTQLSSGTCRFPWQGFGIYLGALASFNATSDETHSAIFSRLYDDLKLRNFRTEFLPDFSPSEDVYAIECTDVTTCSWINLHSAFARSVPLDEVSLIVSMWSPPHYMKNFIRGLKPSYERSYYYYLKNITSLVQDQFGLTIERISIDNEPENVFASWDVCVMSANQLCRMVQNFNDSVTSMCPENSWFTVSKLYRDFRNGDVNCRSACSVVTSHAYTLNINPFHDFGTVYYDLNVYPEDTQSPVWITEVSSTRKSADKHQIDEALDMSVSIINFVGTTCIQRWYLWYAFTNSPSGESLIWLDQSSNQLILPKKYYAYRHFTLASYGTSDRMECTNDAFYCLKFMPNGKSVYINESAKEKRMDSVCDLCCTTADTDWSCKQTDTLPSRSICSC